MKKTIVLFGSLLILAGTKSKAQTLSQVPPKKDTVSSVGKKNAPIVNPKSVNPTFAKGASSSTSNSVEQRHNPPPASNSVAPRHNH